MIFLLNFFNERTYNNYHNESVLLIGYAYIMLK
jgi:hypothetical protein